MTLGVCGCVSGTRSRVTQIVRDIHRGSTPDRIHEEYPHLSLAQIYAALSFYYDHKADLDSQIEAEDDFVAKFRAGSNQPSRDELVSRYQRKIRIGAGGGMSVALYMDVHVPIAVARELNRRGCEHPDRSRGWCPWRFADSLLLDRATSLGRVLVSEDQDFLVEAARRQASECAIRRHRVLRSQFDEPCEVDR